jgi:putative sterol carrier protein
MERIMTTPEEVFTGRISRAVGRIEATEDTVYQFSITGDEGCEYIVDLNDRSVRPGKHDAPGATIIIDSTDFIDMVEGRVAGPNLFMSGKLKVEGNIALAMKLGTIFG